MSDNALIAAGIGSDLTSLLRQQILNGELPADQRLLPRDLQERYGVSHIPIREAMRTLAAEGLVVYEPRKGAKVSGVSRSQLEEVYRLRRRLEPPLAKHAAETRDCKQLESAERAYALMVETGTSNLESFLPCHSAFHWALLDVGLGPLTQSILQQTSNISERYVRLGFAAFQVDDQAQHDHAALMQAFRKRDGERIEFELDRHLHVIENTLCAHLGAESLKV